MKKSTLLFAVMISLAATALGQTPISIMMARAQPVGSVVTIRGTLLNDASKMGWTYYIQDGTGGIAGYDTKFSTAGVKPGDIITVTGKLTDYKSLLEINPVSAVTIVSSDNPLPIPSVLTVPDFIDYLTAEQYESMLVTMNNVHFDPLVQGKLFNGGTNGVNYDIIDQSGKKTQVRILPLTDLQNTLVPMGNVNITGCLGQYNANPNLGFQLIPRSLKDIIVNSSIKLTSPVTVSDITTTSVSLNWTTDAPGSTFLKYGKTPLLELGILSASGTGVTHAITITGTASELFYARAFSISNTVATDTAKSSIGAYITGSNSSGDIKVFFNTPVDISVSTGTNAIYLNNLMDDKLIEYINAAKQSIDITIYNFNNTGLSNISTALNAAASRGVNVRVIYCGTTASLGIGQLDAAVHRLQGPGINNTSNSLRNGIMHNKFMVIDVNSTNANDPLVWTGSVNWTDLNMNFDANNVIIIQDQSLARTYLTEFEEMWGSKSLTPNTTTSKFGSSKTDNTPHQLKVGGKWMECYFSPSDNVNVEIINRMKSANSDIEAATMLITRKEMAYAVSDAVASGASAKFLVTSFSDEVVPANPPTYPNADSTVFKTLKKACFKFADYTGGGIMHNKYMIVDQSNSASDPLVWTGSHNWSAGANNDNDENSIVIHDATIANIYYQNFAMLMKSATVYTDVVDVAALSKNDLMVYPNPANTYVNIDVKSSTPGFYKFQLLDLAGRLVREKKQEASIGITHSGFDLAGLKAGFYLVKISNWNGSYSQKLIIK